MSDSKVIVLGSVNTDLVIRSERIPRPGETVLGGQFYRASGGKGANQAVAAARAALHPVTFIAAVGDDAFGRDALAAFEQENLDRQFIRVVPQANSGVALILVDEQGENSIAVASGANLQLSPADVDAVPDEVFSRAKVFLTCLESPIETVERGLRRAREAGLTTILNPAPAGPLLERLDLLKLVDVLTPNAGEAAMLVGMPADREPTDEMAAEVGRELQYRGAQAVVVTRGADGVVVVDDETALVPAVKAQPQDTTAAGDAFNGALATSLSEGRMLRDAVRWGIHAAAISVTRAGAQPSLPTRAEIDASLASDVHA